MRYKAAGGYPQARGPGRLRLGLSWRGSRTGLETLIKFLAKFFRGLHLIFGVSASSRRSKRAHFRDDLARSPRFSRRVYRAPLLSRALPVFQAMISPHNAGTGEEAEFKPTNHANISRILQLDHLGLLPHCRPSGS